MAEGGGWRVDGWAVHRGPEAEKAAAVRKLQSTEDWPQKGAKIGGRWKIEMRL